MASITPRMSALLAENYFEEHMDDENDDSERQEEDGRTPLDRTIDRIGMGTLNSGFMYCSSAESIQGAINGRCSLCVASVSC